MTKRGADNIMLVAVDNGYWSTKYYDGEKCRLIKSRVEQVDDFSDAYANVEGRFHVEYNGKCYIVGEAVERQELGERKTEQENHKILTLVALSQLASSAGVFTIGVGLPINYYKSQRADFANYLRTKGAERIIVNGKEKTIEIRNVFVYPQAAGAIYADHKRLQKYQDTKFGILDFGGKTIDGVVFDMLKVDRSSKITVGNGSIHMISDITNEIASKYSIQLKESTVENIIEKHDCKMTIRGKAEDIRPIVERVQSNCVDGVKRSLINAKWEIDVMPILVIGGDVLIPGMANAIKKFLPMAEISADPVYDNVKGFFAVLQEEERSD